MNQQMIFGVHPVMEAVASGREIGKVLLRKGMDNDAIKTLKEVLREHNVPLQIVPLEKLNRLSRKNHQGVIAFISPVEYIHVENLIPQLFESGEDPFVVVCEGVTDTRNIGAIARSAECAGAHAILFPVRGSAMISADTVKTSAGALNHIAVCRIENLLKTILFLKNSGLKVVAASEKAKETYYEANFKGPVVLLLGAEDTGISSELLKLADIIVKIPVRGKISSLNVSAAAAVLIYEKVRQETLK